MKKTLAMLLMLALLACVCGAVPAFAADGNDSAPPLPPFVKKDVKIVSIFANAEAQPMQIMPGAPEVMLDSVWIYYSDNTFDQYAEIPQGYVLFSTGTYSLLDGADFVLGKADGDGSIVIERSQKYSPETGALADYSSSHKYQLGTLGYAQLFGPDSGGEVEAVFIDSYRTLYKDANDVVKGLDTIWIYFEDGSFRDFVFLDGNVVFNGSGSYAFDDAGDFHILPYEEDYGTITHTWDVDGSVVDLGGQSQTFNLGEMGLTCLFVKYDPNLTYPELPTGNA